MLTLIQSIALDLNKKYQDMVLSTRYAWWMLQAITNKNKTSLLLQKPRLSTAQQTQLNHWIDKQTHHHMPLQYLIGSVPFGNCTITVEPPILIPRPETEQWCLTLIKKLQQLPSHPLTILDIGTGSGCIAIALAKAFTHATIYAVDISSHALRLAQQNAQRNNVHNIIFLESNLFEKIPATIRFDMVVSNPPYIAQQEWLELDPSVRAWEDPQALIAADEGTAILKKIIAQTKSYLKPQSLCSAYNIARLVVEIGHQQGAMVASFFKKAKFDNVTIEKDLFGNDRIVTGYINEVNKTT
jgi:release factor glutamine methyltransferase